MSTVNKERKRGALSTSDMNFIRANVDKIPLSQIAEYLNRTTEPIESFIRKERLGKEYEMAREGGDKSEHMVMQELKKKPFYKILSEQLSIDELKLFTEQWVSFVLQFGGDILPSEELELRELLFYEVLKNRVLIEEKQANDVRAELRQEEAVLTKIPVSEREKSDREVLSEIRTRIAVFNDNLKDYRRTFKDLADKADKVRKSLYSSRARRTEDIDKAKIDFTSLLKLMQDYEYKKKAAREMEVMKEAKRVSYEKLTELYEFKDGVLDYPVLNSEVVLNESDK